MPINTGGSEGVVLQSVLVELDVQQLPVADADACMAALMVLIAVVTA